MSDWYMKRQLENFKQGVRGSHPQDFSGAQMSAMAKTLKDDQAIDDVVKHIDSM
jgi:cytochrome c oxidase subunit 2